MALSNSLQGQMSAFASIALIDKIFIFWVAFLYISICTRVTSSISKGKYMTLSLTLRKMLLKGFTMCREQVSSEVLQHEDYILSVDGF